MPSTTWATSSSGRPTRSCARCRSGWSKGAYWDVETIKASAQGWKSPVWPEQGRDRRLVRAVRVDARRERRRRPPRVRQPQRCGASPGRSAPLARKASPTTRSRSRCCTAWPNRCTTPCASSACAPASTCRWATWCRAWPTSCGVCSRTRRTSRSCGTASPRAGRSTTLVAPPQPGARSSTGTASDGHRTDPDEPGRFVNEPPAELRRDDVQTRLGRRDRAGRDGARLPGPLLVDGVAIDTRDQIVSVDPGNYDVTVCRSASATVDHVNAAIATTVAARVRMARDRLARPRRGAVPRRRPHARPARRARSAVRARSRQAARRGRRRRVRGDRLLRVLRPRRAAARPTVRACSNRRARRTRTCTSRAASAS